MATVVSSLRGFIAVLLIASCSCGCGAAPSKIPVARIEGEVAGCFARTRIFTIDAIDIYAFDLSSNNDVLTKLKALPQEPPTSENIEAFTGLQDSFIKTVRQEKNVAGRTRTDGNGRYVLTGLKQGAEYLVIAIVPPQEDSEEYFLDKTTNKLNTEETTVNLWAEDTPKEQCHP